MCTDRTYFDVIAGRQQNQGYFQRICCNRQTIVFTYNIATSNNYFYTIYGVAVHTVNSLKIRSILLPS